MDWNVNLLLALIGHGCADFSHEPSLKFLAGLQSPTSNNERVGIKRVHHFIKEESESMRLHAEDFLAHGISLIRKTTHSLRCLMKIHLAEFMPGILWQVVGQQVFFNRGERAQRLQVARSPAIA